MSRISALLVALSLSLIPHPSSLIAHPSSLFEVIAVRYATIRDFPVRSLVAGDTSGRRMDIAMSVWVVRQGDRVALVDAGFYRQKFIDQWQPADYVRPDKAIEEALGITPGQVTDIVVTHVHWDHADGADLFPRAKIWIQKDEYGHHVGPAGEVLARAIDADVATMFDGLRRSGRVELVDGDDREVLPGLRVYTGGRHTFASQFAGVTTRSGVVILASDNAYLFENLERKVAIAQTLDAASNLAAQTRMLQLAARPSLVIPGHDPAVFASFPAIGARAVRID